MVERTRRPYERHGASGTPAHQSWKDMRDRCNNPRNKRYETYGERGITVCERWDSFSAFLEDMGLPDDVNCTIEREDINLGYSPSNCYWASKSAQCHNKTNTVYAFIEGKRYSVAEAARRLRMPETTLRYRVRKGLAYG